MDPCFIRVLSVATLELVAADRRAGIICAVYGFLSFFTASEVRMLMPRRFRWIPGIFAALAAGAAWPAGAADFPAFEGREIDPHVGEVCYAVTLADVDGDKKTDIVAVSEN